MFKKILASFLFALTVAGPVFAAVQNVQVETWNSEEGLTRLKRSEYKNDFYQLVNFYQPQINPLYCSAATGVTILNALNYGNIASQAQGEAIKPESMGGGVIEFHLYTQKMFFNEKTDLVKKHEIIELKEPKGVLDGKEVYDPGLTLGEFSQVLTKAYKIKTRVTYVEKNDETTLNKFRETVKKVLSDEKNLIVVNFDGKVLGQKTNGHISLLAAYDEESDSVLILDTALHKNQWYFAPVEKLVEAMNTKDGEKFRGYMVVSK